MTSVAVIIALAVSVWGLWHLQSTNPKRLRSLKQEPAERRHAHVARLAVWAPGVLLVVLGQFSAFVMWLAALTVIGWALVAAPTTTFALVQRAWLAVLQPVLSHLAAIRDRLAAVVKSRHTVAEHKHLSDENAELRARLVALEQRIAELEGALHVGNDNAPKFADVDGTIRPVKVAETLSAG